MEYLFIYLLQLSKVTVILMGACAVLIVFGFLLLGGLIVETDFDDKNLTDGAAKLKKILTKITIGSFISLILLSLLPTEKTLLLIGGTYIGKKAINKVVTDSKVEKINTIIELELDKYIDKLKEGEKNG